MIADLELAGQRAEGRRHAGGHRITGFRPFQQAHPLFQHGDGRVAVAAIDIAFLFAGKAALGGFRIVVDIAGGEVDRFRGFAMGRTVQAAAHKFRGITPARGVLSFRVFCH